LPHMRRRYAAEYYYAKLQYMTDTFLIVGLGNPGPEYRNTRHNAGFMVVDGLASACGVYFNAWQGDLAEYAKTEMSGKTVYLFKPLTYMNLSGRAVSSFSNFYKIPPSQILIIFDDISLPLGSVRLRRSGSAGGQNGMKNIIELAGTQDIARLRIGTGPVPPHFDLKDFVLSKFKPADKELLDSALEKASVAVKEMLERGIDEAMTRANAKS